MIPHNLVCVPHVSCFFFPAHSPCVSLSFLPPLAILISPDATRAQHTRWFDLISIALTRGDAPRDTRVPLPAARPPPGNRCSSDRAVTRGRTSRHPSHVFDRRVRNFRAASAYTRSSVRFARVTRGTRASRLFNYFGPITSHANSEGISYSTWQFTRALYIKKKN